LLAVAGYGQLAPQIGLRDHTPHYYALTNARVYYQPGRYWPKANIIIKDGRILDAGPKVKLPQGAKIIDMTGKTIYAGFIEPYLPVGVPDKTSTSNNRHWNPGVHPEYIASPDSLSPKVIKELRRLGFTAALLVPNKGIFRGRSKLISLAGKEAEATLPARETEWIKFEHGKWGDTYPNSLLGAVALVRQTFYDAQWYAQAQAIYSKYPEYNKRPQIDDAVAYLADHEGKKLPFVWITTEEQGALRVGKIAREFNLPLNFLGSGYEYRRLTDIKRLKPFIILPLNFPAPPDVSTTERALTVPLAALRHWDMAPDNPRLLAEANLHFALTSARLKKREDFRNNLERAIIRGLSPKAALASLTTEPARFLGVDKLLGSIEAGKLAYLTVCDGEYWEAGTEVLEVWIEGQRIPVVELPKQDIRGQWRCDKGILKGASLRLRGRPSQPRGSIALDTLNLKLHHFSYFEPQVSFTFRMPPKASEEGGVYRFEGLISENLLSGSLYSPDGKVQSLVFRFEKKLKSEIRPKDEKAISFPVRYPEGAFGLPGYPKQPQTLMVKNAEIWTSGPRGILKNADMLVVKGRIEKIGVGLKIPRNARIIDARGKVVTPGIIDCHSHTALFAVNEGSHAVTSEVRIQDVLNADDVSIYRELAGGVTTIHTLHGSANPIGGQNAIIKLRWGQPPEGLIFKKAPPTLKLALGENVKQSNWGDKYTTRYPQTRMGVEQIIRDALEAARDYQQRWQAYRKARHRKRLIPPRKDLQLEALSEILDGKRFAHPHSYRQDEILALIRVADDYGFKIAAFQHVLEGYKIAEAIAAHGAGASTFSDWWAYKFEVYDAIPYNAALMNAVGVNVSLNSDSRELARRLNLEAAKAVKYGDLSPEEAFKMVTINPARQLKIDKYVGSLEVGKDADFVIWSGNPMDTKTVCEQTWIDGRLYFSRKRDEQFRERTTRERRRLIQKILQWELGTKDQAPAGEEKKMAPKGTEGKEVQ